MTVSEKSSLRKTGSLDMLGKRKDGYIELGIIVGEKLTRSREDQGLLMKKVEAYLKAINSEAFRKDYDNPLPHKTVIIIKFLVEPDLEIIELVKQMDRWVRDNNARIRSEREEPEAPGVQGGERWHGMKK
jgi:hypothetical protein